MSGRRIALSVGAAALVVRALHVAFIHGHPFWELQEQWPSSDMYQYAAWARHLASGDWLDRDTFRAWFEWQEAVAPREVWNSWYGAHVYYQPPLYPYLAALALALTGSLDAFRFAQAALGAVNCAMVALLALRLYGATAGWVAGLAAALYAPWVVYDAELLRGTFTLATQAALLLALVTWHRAGSAYGAGSGHGAGSGYGPGPASGGTPPLERAGSGIGPGPASGGTPPPERAGSGIGPGPASGGTPPLERAGSRYAGLRPAGSRRLAMLCGLILGVAWLTDPVIISFAPVAACWILWSCRARSLPMRGTAESLALFAAGAALAVSPLIARNAIVGAPLLSNTTRAPLAFVMGNAPDAQPAGATIPPSAPGILSRAGYTMSGTIRETLALHHGRWGPLLALQWSKLAALWGSFEIPDNPSFYYAARISPAIRFGLPFVPVAAAALVGLALSIAAGIKGRDPLMALLPLFLASAMAIFVMAHVVSRYRQPMLLALLPAAGFAAAWSLERGLKARAGAAVAAVVLALVLPWGPPPGYGYNRPAEFIMTARIHARRGAVDAAVNELKDAMDLARREALYRPAVALLHYETGMIEQDAGRAANARSSFRAALKEDPDFTAAADALRALGER